MNRKWLLVIAMSGMALVTGAWLLQRLRLRGRVLERVVPPVEVDALVRPEPVHDLELLREHRDARRRFGEREAVGEVLALHPARAEPELDTRA